MSKYVIELGEDAQIVHSINVTQHGNAYTKTERVDNLEELNSDYINEHFGELQQDAYDRGYKDGRNVTETQAHDDAYQRGLDDAWEAARKIALMDTETSENVTGYFGLFRIMENLTPMQAIAKLKAYEEKQADKIEVGDGVNGIHSKEKGVVTQLIGDTQVYVLWHDGSSGIWGVNEVTKTGRHFDIASILEVMKHD